MKIKRATITNLRVLSKADFEFDPKFTLVVGVNGVGKSTLLDALRVCASRILPSITRSRAKAMSFSQEDIPKDLPFLDIDLFFEVNRRTFSYNRREWREKHAKDAQGNIDRMKRVILESERPRARLRDMLRKLDSPQIVSDSDNFDPSLDELQECVRRSKVSHNCIFFSTARSVISEAGASKSQAIGHEAAAYAEALSPRPLYLAQIADWMRAQSALASERPLSKRHLRVLELAVTQFLPGYKNLRPGRDNEPRLAIEKGGITLDVRQLSDGERGVLCLVLDIARRLSQANPDLRDPLKQGAAVVLIDELDLHLHPKWQRTIVDRLTTVFPRCQFIATTHSPQIVAAVEPEQVLLFKDGKVIRPERTLGMDTNWILRHLMEADERPLASGNRIKEVERLIRDNSFRRARAAIANAIKHGYDLPEWPIFDARMARLEILTK